LFFEDDGTAIAHCLFSKLERCRNELKSFDAASEALERKAGDAYYSGGRCKSFADYRHPYAPSGS
jgi:hypothetical protein